MRKFKKAAIIGTGLIGGSIALALKRKKIAAQVVGVAQHKNTLSLAKKNGIVDCASQSLEIIRGSDLLIFATPVKTILKLAKPASELVSKNCLVTDVGSTKLEITSKLSRIFPNFVGSHPLAGSERRGILHAREDMFKASLCVLTPKKITAKKALKEIEKLWRSLGAQVVKIAPQEHDKIIAFVSHLPHLVAFSLIGAVPENFLKFAASGLKDTTRIAGSDCNLWSDIFLSNKELLRALKSFQKKLAQISLAIKNKDKKKLIKILEASKKRREIL